MRFTKCMGDNNFNQQSMSSSLPRIRTYNELGKNTSQSTHAPPLKFKKLTLEPTQNGQQRRKSVKTIKTQRLKSLQRYSSVQEQREFKNQKIHLNLIERKLLNGTYDEKKETGNELNGVKQKRDHMKVEANLKERQIQRTKFKLRDIKKQIQDLLSHKGDDEKKLKEIRDRFQLHNEKAQVARQNHSILQQMFKIRHDINLNFTKRHNDQKQYCGHIMATMNMLDTELRELTEKNTAKEVKLQSLMKAVMKDRNERNEIIAKHQEKISKRKEDQIMQSQKSKQYVAHLDQKDRINQMREFHTRFDKILANVFISKYLKTKQTDLHLFYQKYEYSYKKLCTYRSFDHDQPKQMVQRYFEHETQKVEREKQIKEKQIYLEGVEAKNEKLKKEYMNIEIQLMQSSQRLDKSLHQFKSESRKQDLQNLQKEALEAEQKTNKVKKTILRLLNKLNQRGDKRLSGSEPAVTNINQLTSITLQLAKQQ